MKEEIAIVTGSNRGIGFACVKECVSLGKFTLSPEVDRKFMVMSTKKGNFGAVKGLEGYYDYTQSCQW